MSIKKMLPLFHKLFGMLFADMKKSDMDDKQIDWYIDTLASLMSILIIDVYEDKSEFDKLFNNLEDDYSKFESEIMKPEAKA